MKERGIIMSAPMVLALLDGRKMQTRRIVDVKRFGENETHKSVGGFICVDNRWRAQAGSYRVYFPYPGLFCPHGIVGDRLWVRETWKVASKYDDYSPTRLGDGCYEHSEPFDRLRDCIDAAIEFQTNKTGNLSVRPGIVEKS